MYGLDFDEEMSSFFYFVCFYAVLFIVVNAGLLSFVINKIKISCICVKNRSLTSLFSFFPHVRLPLSLHSKGKFFSSVSVFPTDT